MKVRTELLGEYTYHGNPYIQGTTVLCDTKKYPVEGWARSRPISMQVAKPTLWTFALCARQVGLLTLTQECAPARPIMGCFSAPTRLLFGIWCKGQIVIGSRSGIYLPYVSSYSCHCLVSLPCSPFVPSARTGTLALHPMCHNLCRYGSSS